MKAYRKALIISIIMISVIIVNRMIEEKKSYGSDQLVEALSMTAFTIESAEMNISGEYMPRYMTKDEMRVIAVMIADQLGIKNYEEIFQENENRITYTLEKKATAAYTRIELIEKTDMVDAGTYIARNYLTVTIKLFDKCHSISYFENQVTKLFADLKIVPTKGLNVTATHNGIISDEAAKAVMIDIIKALNGEIRGVYIDDSYQSAYGYTKHMKDFVISKGEKVNMDLAVTYDEEKNKTNLYAATPVITIDY